MSNLNALELKAFVPAKDFELSKQFYQDMGFTLCWSEDGMALLHLGDHGEAHHASFLLQHFYVKEHTENFMMHLLVADVDAWWAQIQQRDLANKYGVRAEPPEQRPWGMRDFIVVDPSGVLWRIAQSR